jgi:hypothetical protein
MNRKRWIHSLRFLTMFVLVPWVAHVSNQLYAQQTAASSEQQSAAQPSSQEPRQLAQQRPGQTPEQTGQQSPDSQAQAQPGVQVFTGVIVRSGDKYVLQDSASGATYDIDRQELAKQFEGKRVRIHGTLDPGGKMIHIQ